MVHARAGCLVGQYAVTTPNMDYIVQPQLGQCEVILRSNMRFGLDDFTLWPQWFHPDLPHLPAVPSRPREQMNLQTPGIHCMWWEPKMTDFHHIVVPGAPSADFHRGLGTGFFRSREMDGMRDLYTSLQADVQETEFDTRFLWKVRLSDIRSTASFAHHAFRTLTGCPGTFDEKRLELAEFQRSWLELKGWANLHAFTKARAQRQEGAVTVEECVGCFVESGGAASEIRQLGIPVWWVRPKIEVVRAGLRIEKLTTSVVTPDCAVPKVCTTKGEGFPVIFRGVPRSLPYEHYAVQQQFGRIRPTVPVRANPGTAGSKQPVWSQPTTTLTALDMHRAHVPSVLRCEQQRSVGSILSAIPVRERGAPYRKEDRRKKSPRPATTPKGESEAPWAPYRIPAWSQALSSLNRQRPGDMPKQVFTFPFHDLWDGSNTERISIYTRNWLNIRQAWMRKISQREEAPIQLKAGTWKDILRFGYGTALPTPPTSVNVAEICKDLQPLGMHLKGDGSIVFNDGNVLGASTTSSNTVYTSTPDPLMPRWRDTNVVYHSRQFPSTPILREIVWELHEVNFRFDLQRLDEVLTVQEGQRYTLHRLKTLSGCWHAADGFHDPVSVTWSDRNCGLSANDIAVRLPHLRALYGVFESWTNFPMPMGAARIMDSRVTEDDAEAIERRLVAYFVQRFFDHFGRPPVFPQRLHSVP